MKKMVSLVAVMRNAAGDAEAAAVALSSALRSACEPHGFDHELIFIDNGSTDGTYEELERAVFRVPDSRALSLVSAGEPDPAFLAGMDLASGDWVVLTDPTEDDPTALGALVDAVSAGADIALAAPSSRMVRGRAYGIASAAFVAVFRFMTGVDLRTEAGRYRAMSQKVVAWVTQHDNAAMAHRTLPSRGGFRTVVVKQDGLPLMGGRASATLGLGLRRAMNLVTSTSTAPLRLATQACAAAALLSLLYSVYVAAVYVLRAEVAPGWTTLSLQISAMFFLLSIAVALLAEYVLQMAASSFRRPPYQTARDVRSKTISREGRLNVVGADGGAVTPP